MNFIKSLMSTNGLIGVALITFIATQCKSLLAWVYKVFMRRYAVGATFINTKCDLFYEYLLRNTSGRSNNILRNNYQVGDSDVSLDYGVYMISCKKRLIILYSYKEPNNSNGYTNFLSFNIFGWGRQELIKEIQLFVKNYYKDTHVYLNNVTKPSASIYRPLSSIKDKIYGTKHNKIIDFLDNWVAHPEIYDEMGRIRKCGILLYGKPGTGKTSLVTLIAKRYGINIIDILDMESLTRSYVLTPYGMMDTRLSKLENKLSLVLIEEVDTFYTEVESTLANMKEAQNKLLQFLDGVTSKHNTIIIMTTNHVENLADNMMRDGRCDLKVELDDLSREEANEMCVDHGYIIDDFYDYDIDKINPAELERKILDKKLKI